MARTLGNFTSQDNGTFTGTYRGLQMSTGLTFVPIQSNNPQSPTHRIYAGNGRVEVGAGWAQIAETSGREYINVKLASPEFGPYSVRARLVELEDPNDDGSTHILLWNPTDQ